jgi:VanZ family protein
MAKFSHYLSLWLPVIFWAALIFYFSSIPNLKASQNPFWDEIIRSGAHFIFYAFGYFLFFRAINFGRKQKNFWQPLALVVLYGLFDEIHQNFVPTRTFQLKDLLVNFSGAIVGLLTVR